MKILLLSFYYPPDLSAGSFRASALVSALLEKLPQTGHIELITTMPNRYNSYRQVANDNIEEHEQHPRLTIHRVAVPQHQSGMKDQSKAFLNYARSVLRITRNQSVDLVFATSSRLMTAALGALLSRRLKAPLYLDIRDIFVETLRDVLSPKISWLAKPIFGPVESWTIHYATRVNLIMPAFLGYFESKYPRRTFSVFTNGIDPEFLDWTPESKFRIINDPLTIVYAGNMGEGQGLHKIVPALAKRLEGQARFVLVGDGGKRLQLENALAERNCKNVQIRNPVSRTELIEIYQQADVFFLHLNDYNVFLNALPSKLFEYGALGKPILAGVSGYAARFIQENLDNAQTFTPCCPEEGIKAFFALRRETFPREKFVETFDRRNIMRNMADDVLITAKEPDSIVR